MMHLAAIGAAALLLFGSPAAAQDTTLVEVMLVETRERITVEAVVTDSTVRLPGTALRDLLGVSFVGPWVSLDQLRTQYPTLVVQWRPAELRVLVFDEASVLPATRTFREQHRASAFNAVAVPIYSGPFLSAAVDDSLRAAVDGGYNFRGRFVVAGRLDNRGAGSWGVTLAPTPHVFLDYQDGVYRSPTVSGRLAAGPLWLFSAYTPTHPVELAGLLRIRDVQIFASRDFGAVTWQGGLKSIQIAHTWQTGRTAARISLGPVPVSPFSFPSTTIR
jgi:hypothetical protein